METATLIRTADVVQRTHLTYRQLDHWRRMGYINPAVPSHGSGTRALYAESQLPILKFLAAVVAITFRGQVGSARGDLSILARIWDSLSEDPSPLEWPIIYVTPDGWLSDSPATGFCLLRADWS